MAPPDAPASAPLPRDVVAAIGSATSLREGRDGSRAPLSPESKKTYLSNLRKVLAAYVRAHPDAPRERAFDDMLVEVDATVAAISGGPRDGPRARNMHTVSGQVAAVSALFQRIPRLQTGRFAEAWPKWQRLSTELKKTKQAVREKNELTEAQGGKFLSMEAIRARFARLMERFRAGRGEQPEGEWALFVKRLLLLALYAMHPPLRQDYGCIRLCAPAAEGCRRKRASRCNHILMGADRWTLVLLNYKTTKHYGRVESDLAPEIVEVASESLRLEPREFLFVRRDKRPYRDTVKSTNSFTALVNRSLSEILEHPADVTSVRRAYATWLGGQSITFAERRRAAEIMGHSVLQSLQYEVVDREHVRVGGATVPLSELTDVERRVALSCANVA